MFCKACGQSIDRGDKFCRNCGVPLAQEAFEANVSASSSLPASTVGVASSTAELQRPLPIPKAKPAEAATEPSAAPQTAAEESKAGSQEMRREAAAPVAEVATAPTPAAEPQAQPVEVAATAAPEESRPAVDQQIQLGFGAAAGAEVSNAEDASRGATGRPVRLCPRCHRIVGDEAVVCERCKAKLDAPAPEPASVSEDYGVPSFAGYAAGKTEKAEAEPSRIAASDPTGIDELAILRRPRRRRLPVLEILVAVILIVGAGFAVWMMRSSLPGKTVAANVAVTIDPAKATVVAGHGVDFAATVTGSDNIDVDWSVQEGSDGGRIVPRGAKARDGAVASLAVYMAPKAPGTYHLIATSKANPDKSATARITVTSK